MIHIVLMLLCFAVASAQVHKKGMTMKLTIDGQVFHVNTNDDPLVKQIAVMCPLSLEFSRSGNHEYYSRLPRKVDESNSTKTTNNSSLKFEIKAKQFYAASQRVL